jgi:MoxR-like ATPase
MKVLSLKTEARKEAFATDAVPNQIQTLRQSLEALLRGKADTVETLLCALGSQGHVLLEDVPGVGKTTVIKALAKMLGLEMSRIQCTSDLLPSDILGVEIYSPQKDAFIFHPGPVFSSILFVDELNRCSPRTQSALLEAMAEGVVTVNRRAYPLPKPFLVFATQNPSEYTGTYALPESQLDRFAARIQMGYPLADKEREILMGAQRDPIAAIPSNIVPATFVAEFEQLTERVQTSDRLVAYAMRVIQATRSHAAIVAGVSTRGAVAWLRMAKARALLENRNYVIPDDLMALAERCLAHRLVIQGTVKAGSVLTEILTSTPVE